MSRDPRILAFLKHFVRTLAPEEAAHAAGISIEEAEGAISRSKALQRRLAKMFEKRTTLYDHVPLSVVRAQLLAIMVNPQIQAGHRVQAAKLVLDLITEGMDDRRAMIGTLLKAVENAEENG